MDIDTGTGRLAIATGSQIKIMENVYGSGSSLYRLFSFYPKTIKQVRTPPHFPFLPLFPRSC